VRRAIATVLLTACTAVALTACGQKGPLTLPDKSATVVTTAPATPATATPATATPKATPATSTTAAPVEKSKDKSGNTQPPQ
jgi:predicted small lipoprotein YifL